MSASAAAPAQQRGNGGDGNTCLMHTALGVWGLCSWILFNSLWGMLPLFIRTLPEGNRLGVLMIAAMQLAYLFPLAFMFKKGSRSEKRSSLEIDIWVLLISGLIISLLLSSFWNVVAPVGGASHSVGLLTLTFLAGAVCSSTGVVFMPFLANHPQSRSFTSAFAAGGGLSGLLVAFLAMIADPGAARPRLGVATYFYTLSAVFVLSICAFLYVRQVMESTTQYRPLDSRPPAPHTAATVAPAASGIQEAAPTAKVVPSGSGKPKPITLLTEEAATLEAGQGPTTQPSNGSTHHNSYGSMETPSTSASSSAASSPRWVLPPSSLWPVLVIQCLLSSLAYGVVPSVLPLACTGYAGSDASNVLQWAIISFMVADPLGKIAVSFFCTHMVYVSASIALTFAVIILLCAGLSPYPPLYQYSGGASIPVVANACFSFMLSFTSTSIFLQKVPNGKLEATKWFRWSAFMNQTGAFIGAGLTLILVYSHK